MDRRHVLSTGLVAATGLVVPASIAHADDPGPTVTASVNRPLTRLFTTYGNTSGLWSGADSAYSVPLPDGSTAWLYSDTFIGPVNPDGSRPRSAAFVNNSIIVQRGGRLRTVVGGTEAAPAALVAPAGVAPGTGWYWFGDGTVEGSMLRVLVLQFTKTGTGVFDFVFVRTAIASFSLPGMDPTSITALPESPIQWASAIRETPQWTYVYGVEDNQSQKYAHVARVPRGRLTTDPWQYWDGAGWNADIAASARILEGVANEYSVSEVDGRLVLVTQEAREPLSRDILAYEAMSPVGPFRAPLQIYATPETEGDRFTYNAKLHPQLSRGSRWVITYNVNSFDTDDVYADVENYRPRYVTVTVRR